MLTVNHFLVKDTQLKNGCGDIPALLQENISTDKLWPFNFFV